MSGVDDNSIEENSDNLYLLKNVDLYEKAVSYNIDFEEQNYWASKRTIKMLIESAVNGDLKFKYSIPARKNLFRPKKPKMIEKNSSEFEVFYNESKKEYYLQHTNKTLLFKAICSNEEEIAMLNKLFHKNDNEVNKFKTFKADVNSKREPREQNFLYFKDLKDGRVIHKLTLANEIESMKEDFLEYQTEEIYWVIVSIEEKVNNNFEMTWRLGANEIMGSDETLSISFKNEEELTTFRTIHNNLTGTDFSGAGRDKCSFKRKIKKKVTQRKTVLVQKRSFS